MTQPYSSDLRKRVVRARLAGEPIRQVGARFGVSVSSAPKWVVRYRETESVAPGKVGGRNMVKDDFAVIAGRDHHDQGDAVMPGQGRAVERPFTSEEGAAMGDTPLLPGNTTFGVHLNADAFWRNVTGPTALAATRSSRNGSPTENAISLGARAISRPVGDEARVFVGHDHLSERVADLSIWSTDSRTACSIDSCIGLLPDGLARAGR